MVEVKDIEGILEEFDGTQGVKVFGYLSTQKRGNKGNYFEEAQRIYNLIGDNGPRLGKYEATGIIYDTLKEMHTQLLTPYQLNCITQKVFGISFDSEEACREEIKRELNTMNLPLEENNTILGVVIGYFDNYLPIGKRILELYKE